MSYRVVAPNLYAMLTNYLTTFLRILMRQKIYSAINIFGLAIGIAATLLIALYINDELSYDKFHKDADRIYRIGVFTRTNGNEIGSACTATPIAEALQREVPEVNSVTRISGWPSTVFHHEGRTNNPSKLQWETLWRV